MPLLLDGPGILYVTFAFSYTLLFSSACAIVWFHRSLPLIRMRKPVQMLGALVLLHMYLVLCLLTYPMNGKYPCTAEYWVMAVYLPCGIGLYQASNQRLLITSRKQINLSKGLFPVMKRHTRFIRLLADLPGKWRSIVWRYDFWVYTFLIVQSVLSLVIFLISRKFHPFGIVSEYVESTACRRGWEWLPTSFWMFLWGYVFGPLLLWNVHMIRDIYYWRLQTIIAVVASLPGPPLWLAALYSHRMAEINKHWIPAMWFVPGLIIIEVVTLVFPLLQIYNHRRMARDHPKITAGLKESTSGSYDVISEPTTAKATNSSRGKLYTMEGLERCLTNENERNCLQDFACNREFTGENIMFLTQVHDFQSHWYPFCNSDSELSLAAKRRMFEAALTIFAHLVCPDTASVYINVEGRIYKALNAILGDAARAHVSTANTNEFGTSISMTSLHPTNIDGISLNSGKSMATEIITPIASDTSREGLIASPKSLSHVVVDDLVIAEGFGLGIFNEAYESVKNMVYAQTWQRFNQEKDKVRQSSSNSV